MQIVSNDLHYPIHKQVELMVVFFGGGSHFQLHQRLATKNLEVLAFGSASLPPGAAGSGRVEELKDDAGGSVFLKWLLEILGNLGRKRNEHI